MFITYSVVLLLLLTGFFQQIYNYSLLICYICYIKMQLNVAIKVSVSIAHL